MSSPILLETYPANEDSGIPVGIQIRIKFDQGIDIVTAEKAVIVHGPDRDISSGPFSAEWISLEKERDPFYLTSPHFRGVIDCDLKLIYEDADQNEVDDPTGFAGEAGLTPILVITPKKSLAANAEYFVNIVGGTNGISKRTVYSGIPTVTGSGTCSLRGFYTAGTDSVQVEITTAGDISTARYKWWYTSLGVGSAITNRTLSRKARVLEDGLNVVFGGSDFEVGDRWTFSVYTPEYMEDSVQISFTTNDGSYIAAPESPSTPAPSLPPVYPNTDSTDQYRFGVLESDPYDGEPHVALDRSKITIKFSGELDPLTVTQQTVRVYRMPVSGLYGTGRKAEMVKSIVVDGNVLEIDLGG